MGEGDFGAFYFSEQQNNLGIQDIAVFRDIFGKLHRYSYMRSTFPFKKKVSYCKDAIFIGFGWFYGSYTAYSFYNSGLARDVKMKP
ncbi:MAG TPA: hypothetical protein PLI45_04225 [Candidatus Woesebacteria bacterium]|nr:hypothetical protein [Candidatus Woesebacteria bacterium]